MRSNRQQSRRGAAAVLAMLFMVVATTLVVGMYSMTRLNAQSTRNGADAERALAAAQSGLDWFAWRLTQIPRPATTSGTVTTSVADTLWPTLKTNIAADFTAMTLASERTTTSTTSSITSSSINTGDTSFVITVQRHPTYTGDPLDARYIRVTSTGTASGISRTMAASFKLTKSIPYAVVSRTRIQIGRNTLVEGAMGMATASKTPPYLLLGDFDHLDTNLTNQVRNWYTFIESYNTGSYNNRVAVGTPLATTAQSAGYTDYNVDGYIDDYDLFVKYFDRNNDKAVSKAEFTNPSTGALYDDSLFKAIDTLDGPRFTGDPARSGYNDGVISNADGYAKVEGQIAMAVSKSAWESDLAGSGSTIYDMMQGPITAARNVAPVKFSDSSLFDTSAANFEQATINFKNRSGTSAGTASRSATVIANTTLAVTDANGTAVTERTPYGSTTYQATYKRPVFKNLTLRNVIIPKGMNALFDNCVFEGVTFVDGTRNITNNSNVVTTNPDEGMTWSQRKISGAAFTKDIVLLSSGTPTSSQAITQGSQNGNNLRFNNCSFKGPIAGAYATAYTHFANSWEFTGSTLFDNQVDATATIVSPQVNIEMGSFTDPTAAPSTLIGVVVAGNIDIRGTSVVDGSIIVTGDGAGNTTLGYFGPSDGDTNPSAMPEGGYGRLNIRYNPYRALPDGINLPINIVAEPGTFTEVR
ncbi:MAG: hypothetical protein QM770_22315 [Tepidisphaeraceae bacterium]